MLIIIIIVLIRHKFYFNSQFNRVFSALSNGVFIICVTLKLSKL